MVPEIPPADFRIVVSTFATQAAVALGQIENPVTKKSGIDLPQAKFAIDLLDVLKQKTAGNLDAEESGFLEDCLYQLRMLYIDKSAKR
jgi:hypothetical protein